MKKIIFLISLLIIINSCQQETSKRVILLGIDGLSTDGLQYAKTPNLNKLIADGALSLKARGVMPTVSAPNWGSMLCGAGPEQHGMTKNGWTTTNYTVEATTKDEDGYFPSIFTVIREQMPESKTAIFYDWGRLIDLYNKKNIDVVEFSNGYKEVYKKAIPYVIEKKPDFAFIYAGHVDEVGHSDQHGSPEYYKSVEEVDAEIGKLLKALNDNNLYDETHIIVISDHGGVGYGHGGESMAEIQVPWIIKGPGIIQDRLIEEPVNTYNTACSIAYLFGLSQHDHWIGKPVLGVFEKSEISRQNQNSYLPKPKASIKSGIHTESQKVSFTVNDHDAEIRYSLDGSVPNKIYSEPIILENTTIVNAVAVKGNKKSISTVVEFTRVVSIKDVSLLNKPSAKYPAEYNGLSLVDGKLGNDDYSHSAWMGFEGEDFEAVIDFGALKKINKISLRCLELTGSWIFLPNQVEILTSNNGKKFQSVSSLGKSEIKSPDKRNTVKIVLELNGIESRFIKVRAKNIGVCPKGHPGEGGKAWLFVDEVIVE